MAIGKARYYAAAPFRVVYNLRQAIAASHLAECPHDWPLLTGHCIDAPEQIPAGWCYDANVSPYTFPLPITALVPR